MLKDFVPRLYQETILDTCIKKNTLVVLPTGMGKTAIALMLTIHRLKNFPNSKILFLSPTKPLVEQHLKTFKKHLDFAEEKLQLFTGLVSPEKRAELWKDVQIIFSTPQGLSNDIISDKIDISNVSLLIVDEAHRATGDYDYCFIAKQYNKKANFPKILALTASPGDNLEKITEVCTNLFIEEVEIRTEEDPDVKPYVQEIDISSIKVDLPEDFLGIKRFLQNCVKSKLEEVKKLGYIPSFNLTKTELLEAQRKLYGELAKGSRDFNAMKSVSLIAEAIKTEHAIELLETQGIIQLSNYLEKIELEAGSAKTKAVKNLVKDLNFRSALIKTRSLVEKKIEHPKLAKLCEILKEEIQKNKKSKTIIFTQFRDSAVLIKKEIEKIQLLANVFVGQTKKGETGLSQKQQAAMLDEFRDGMFNILIATSVGEEGLDIPAVDLVIFYEPVPSAIRHIQRRGRTARQEKGRVIVLIAKNTRDEAFSWSAKNKEKRMYKVLQDLKGKFNGFEKQKDASLTKFIDKDKVKIFADYREKGSDILKELMELNVEIKLETLDSADYVLSERIGVEVKQVADFVNSIVDGRLLEQLKFLKRNFEKPLVIIEGTDNIYSIRNVHPNAIRGMLATIAISYGIPIINTKDSKETAALLIVLAKREQEAGKEFSPHSEKRISTIKEQQEYVISSLPNVGPQLARELLKNLKNIKNIINASEDELKKIEGIGDKIAKGIKDVSEKDYEN